MDFAFDETTLELQRQLLAFMDECVYPAEARFRDEAHGAGLTNLQYAPLAEITVRNPWIAPEAINCSAPDTGNMELLSLFGTPEQQRRWLDPLLEGEIRSAFSMTEP